jgi:hypothetical protein
MNITEDREMILGQALGFLRLFDIDWIDTSAKMQKSGGF